MSHLFNSNISNFRVLFLLLLFPFLRHLQTTKAFLPAMLEKDHGHIVTIASLAGHVGITKLVDYCSSKFAAVGFDEAVRLELEILGSQNVLTTCICPFFIQSTGMFEDVNARLVNSIIFPFEKVIALDCVTNLNFVIEAIERKKYATFTKRTVFC